MSAEVRAARPVAALDLDALNERFEGAGAEEFISWAGEAFGPGLALACSLGAEDVVLVELVARLAPETTVFTLDTGRLHQETYEVLGGVAGSLSSTCASRLYFPDASGGRSVGAGARGRRASGTSVEAIAARAARSGRSNLCDGPSDGRRAWITGLRRDQNVTRFTQRMVERDLLHGGLLQDQPPDGVEPRGRMARPSASEGSTVQRAPRSGAIPSIGCAPCTRAVATGRRTSERVAGGGRRPLAKSAVSMGGTVGAPKHPRKSEPSVGGIERWRARSQRQMTPDKLRTPHPARHTTAEPDPPARALRQGFRYYDRDPALFSRPK